VLFLGVFCEWSRDGNRRPSPMVAVRRELAAADCGSCESLTTCESSPIAVLAASLWRRIVQAAPGKFSGYSEEPPAIRNSGTGWLRNSSLNDWSSNNLHPVDHRRRRRISSASSLSKNAFAADGDNRLLWRMTSRVGMDVESVRILCWGRHWLNWIRSPQSNRLMTSPE